jgi:hypothetical protein
MISQSELDGMRATAEQWLPDVCDLFAPAESDDSMGGSSTTWSATPTYASVPCRMSEVSSAGERLIADKLQGGVVMTLVLPYDQVINESYRVRVSGITMEIIGVIVPKSWEITRRAVCKQVT